MNCPKNEFVDFYIQLIIFISRDNLQCSSILRLTRGTKAIKAHTIFILVHSCWRATSGSFTTLAMVSLITQRLQWKPSPRTNLALYKIVQEPLCKTLLHFQSRNTI